MRTVRLFDEDRLAECPVAMMPPDQAWGLETARAFDGVAGDYHRTNSENPILRHMRQRSLSMLQRCVPAGADLIDLGCGPGTDHAAMVAAGYCVTGIDASSAMVHEARARAARLDGPHRPVVLCRSIEQLAKFPQASFDAAFSNFGPLNCVADMASAAEQLHDVLRPGGQLVASVIGRVCPWEIALYVARGQWVRALTRLRRGPVGVPLDGGTVWMHYVSPGEFTRVFERAGFAVRALEGLGVVAPPPYLEAFAARHPSLVSRLLAVDDTVGAWPLLRAMGDHFLVVLQRT